MPTIKNNFVIIETANTTYAMMITPHKDIQHIYYGKKLNKDDIEALVPKRKLLLVNSLYMAGDVSYGIDDMSFEYSFAHRGDSRPSACILCDEDNEVFDFQFDKIIKNGKPSKTYDRCCENPMISIAFCGKFLDVSHCLSSRKGRLRSRCS